LTTALGIKTRLPSYINHADTVAMELCPAPAVISFEWTIDDRSSVPATKLPPILANFRQNASAGNSQTLADITATLTLASDAADIAGDIADNIILSAT